MDPAVLEARIALQVALLRQLAAQTAYDWGRANTREEYAKSKSPILRALARHMPRLPPPSIE
jgi:hypothetical protein